MKCDWLIGHIISITYSRRTLIYLERITLFDVTHMMSMVDLVAIGMETLRINSKYSLEKEFSELIPMNPSIVLYVTRRIN